VTAGPLHRPALSPVDAFANRAELIRLLSSGAPGTIELPAGRIPVAGGLVIGAGWTVRGAEAGGTTLVQPVGSADPLLHVIGSRVRLQDLGLELPAASPGPHEGAQWTAVTVGRYFYPGPAAWVGDISLDGLVVTRAGRCAANSITVIGAVRDLTVRDLDVRGGGTGLMVHWGGVGNGVTRIAGPSYHPHRITVERLTVRSAFEGFCLSAAHDVTVRDTRCEDVEIGFRLLAGDNTDRYHLLGPDSDVNRRITIDGCRIGWCGDLYAIRVAGWGRSEVDGRVRLRAFDDVRLTGCEIEPTPVVGAQPRRRVFLRVPVVLERAGAVDISTVRVVGGGLPQARHLKLVPRASDKFRSGKPV